MVRAIWIIQNDILSLSPSPYPYLSPSLNHIGKDLLFFFLIQCKITFTDSRDWDVEIFIGPFGI